MIPPNQGILYANDSQEIANMAIDLVSNPQNRQALSELGVSSMSDLCNWKVQISHFESMIYALSKKQISR